MPMDVPFQTSQLSNISYADIDVAYINKPLINWHLEAGNHPI